MTKRELFNALEGYPDDATMLIDTRSRTVIMMDFKQVETVRDANDVMNAAQHINAAILS